MTVGWNSQVRIRPREMGKQVGTNIWSSSARLKDEKELRTMTFFFLSFLKKSTPLVISKALTDNSRRVTMTPKVFNKMKTFDTRGINISLLLVFLHQHTWRSGRNSPSLHLLRTSSFPLLGRCTKSFNYIYSCVPWWTV